MASVFYVYQHRKADTGEIFYVGKGQGRLFESTHNRNLHWRRTVNKHGFFSDILQAFADERVALEAEVNLIVVYRTMGLPLVNITDGGEGCSGMKHSDATRRRASLTKTGTVLSEAHKAKLAEANRKRYLDPEERFKPTPHFKGKPSHRRGKKMSEETRKKMSAARTGRACSAETRRKISESNKGKIRSADARRKLSELKIGITPSVDTRRKLSESVKRSWITRKVK